MKPDTAGERRGESHRKENKPKTPPERKTTTVYALNGERSKPPKRSGNRTLPKQLVQKRTSSPQQSLPQTDPPPKHSKKKLRGGDRIDG